MLSVLLLSGCSFGKGKPEQVGKPSTAPGEGIEIEDRVSKLSKQFGVSFSDSVKKAVLNPVDGSPSSGLATLEDTKGSQLITILANLPELTKKEKYSAQLIGNDKPIMLGNLLIAKGGWMIERKVNIDPSAYKGIEVLKDKQVVLKGSF